MKLLKRWWLPACILTLPLQRIPSFDVAVGAHSITLRIGVLVALAGIALFGFGIIRGLKLSVTSPYFWITCYVLAVLASVFISIDSSKSIIVTIATILSIGTGIIVSKILRKEDLPSLYRYFSIASVLVSLFGLYQFLGDSFNLPVSWTGLRPNYVKAIFGFPRIQSTLLEPLFFANYLILPTLLTAGLLYTRHVKRVRDYLQLVLLTVVLTLTLSRGGILGSIAGALILTVLLVKYASIRSALTTLITIVAGVGIAIGLIYGVTNLASHSTKKGDTAVKRYVAQSTTLQASSGSADSDRIVNRRLALQEFHEHPILGGGIGSFGSFAQTVGPGAYPPGGNAPTVNNEYLEVLGETGIAGAISLAGLILSLLWRIIRTALRFKAPYMRTWLAVLVATGAGYGIQYYAFSTLYIFHIWVTIGILIALTSNGFNSATEPKHEKPHTS